MCSTWSVVQLNKELKNRKASTTDNKAALIERMNEYDLYNLIGVEDELDDGISDFQALCCVFREVNSSINLPPLTKRHTQKFV